jgi:hypothetical protein
MKKIRHIVCGLGLLISGSAAAAEDFFDRLDEALTVSTEDHALRLRLSGTADLEGYWLTQPMAPGMIYTESNTLLNPRLSLFLDVQAGRHVYGFAQLRVDRGFDPSDEGFEGRLDEYAVRFSPWDSRFNVQIGKFATAVGNWVPRHGSWENAFVTAPLPYENLTGLWDVVAAKAPATVLSWAHLGTNGTPATEYLEKPLRSPIIWGPSYGRGAAVFGDVGAFKYAVEIKASALASHPDTWEMNEDHWRHPTVSGRLGYRPNPMWNLGVSASMGTYLRPVATPTLLPGHSLGEYRQTVLAQDISFAWHHLQIWAESYEARFENPTFGQAETVAYYVEGKYKFTPQIFGALRWNQQFYGTIANGLGGSSRWGREAWRIDVAPTYRFTPHVQLKFQYSLQHERDGPREFYHLWATQLGVRF